MDGQIISRHTHICQPDIKLGRTIKIVFFILFNTRKFNYNNRLFYIFLTQKDTKQYDHILSMFLEMAVLNRMCSGCGPVH
jgi:hypothetical protein